MNTFLLFDAQPSGNPNKQAVVRKHNKPRPRVAHRRIARFLRIDQNIIWSSRRHSTPSLKMSCKSVQPFSRNLANKET